MGGRSSWQTSLRWKFNVQPRVSVLGVDGSEPTFGWRGRELAREAKPDLEVATGVRRTLCKPHSKEDTTDIVSSALIATVNCYPPGPSMIPVTSSILSSFVTTRIPSSGFVLSSLSSFISRRNTAGVTVFFEGNETSAHREC